MASKKKPLAPLSRNIIRHTNKNGDFYYYNYKQKKITSADSWESQNARVKKRKEEIEEQERKHRQYLKRKRESEKEKEQEKKHRQYLKRKRETKKAKPVPAPVTIAEKTFKKEIKFFDARSVFNDPVFDGVNLTVNINDPANGFFESFSGLAGEFSEWYTMTGAFMHLRDHYNESPFAVFELIETDNITFAKYNVNPS